MSWFVYMLRCADGTLYTGMTNDVEKRLQAHNSGRGAKYTRSRLPVELAYKEACPGRREALSREAALKRLTRAEKLELTAGERLAPPRGAAEIMSKLRSAGYEAYAVGGCVRDSLMGILPHDWDIATSALPEETAACFSRYKTVETGLKHGTLTVLMPDGQYEVTTFRQDGPYSDGRHPDSVGFVRSIGEDLARRDFTMNAIAWSPETGITDPFGGREDIRNRTIRCVGEPERRFREDALRIMRAVRFASVCGFSVEAGTERAMFELRGLVASISGERIREELIRTLMGDGAGNAVTRYRDVLAAVMPEMPPADYCQDNPWHVCDLLTHTALTVDFSPRDEEVRLAAFFHDFGKPSVRIVDGSGTAHYYGHAKAGAAICRRIMRDVLKFDSETLKDVETLVLGHDAEIPPEERAVKKRLAKLGPALMEKMLCLQEADARAQAPELAAEKLKNIAAVRRLAVEIEESGACLRLKELAVNGRDLTELGVPEGPRVGKVLGAMLERVVDGRLPNDRGALLKFARDAEEESCMESDGITEVVAALFRDGDRFMICRRPMTKARGGLWEFVGGKVEPGETPREALARECREELDIGVSAGDEYMSVVHEYPDITVRLTVYEAKIVSGEPRLLEHMDLRWITPEEIPGYEFCPADTEILKKLAER